ncbi:unnamed protein product [Caenorhabditis angaria]|uniref:Uncharacterized protein n=1 Tax=Caenorhabditis angaria TaxID=860376 RepID=A0A9P1IWF7_9PELO|nr:unnamed protein product [Caenorhabditis angaria]
MTTFLQQSFEPLVNRLATSEYQWDVDRKPIQIPKLPLNNRELDLPTNGILLETDLRNVKRRLQEISEQLKVIRGTRMSMSTEQFMGISAFTGGMGSNDESALTNQLNILDIPGAVEKNVDRMDEIRQRLREVRVARRSSPVFTPTDEKKFELEMIEEREKMIEEIRTQQPVRRSSVRFEVNSRIEERSETPKEEKEEEKPLAQFVFENKKQPETPKQAEKPASPPPAGPSTTSYTQMMSLLSQQNADSSSDSDDPVPIRKESAAKPSMGLLSQYLNKPGSDSSSEDEKPLPKPSLTAPKPSTSKMYADDDSEDDFFN